MAPLAAARLLAEALSVVPGVARVELAGHPQAPTGVRVICDDDTDPALVAVGVRRVLATNSHLDLDAPDMGVDIVEEVPVRRHLALVNAQDGPTSDEVEEASTRFRHPSQGSFVTRLVELARAGRTRHMELLRLEVVRGRAMSVAVVLASAGVPVTGHAAVGLDGVDTALADATLRAVGSALHEELFLSPYAVSTTQLGGPVHGTSAVVVGVNMKVPGELPERLIGVAEVVGDIREAVVRATLDAVNRRLATPEAHDAHDDRMNG
jgi:hypothetical protein